MNKGAPIDQNQLVTAIEPDKSPTGSVERARLEMSLAGDSFAIVECVGDDGGWIELGNEAARFTPDEAFAIGSYLTAWAKRRIADAGVPRVPVVVLKFGKRWPVDVHARSRTAMVRGVLFGAGFANEEVIAAHQTEEGKAYLASDPYEGGQLRAVAAAALGIELPDPPVTRPLLASDADRKLTQGDAEACDTFEPSVKFLGFCSMCGWHRAAHELG